MNTDGHRSFPPPEICHFKFFLSVSIGVNQWLIKIFQNRVDTANPDAPEVDQAPKPDHGPFIPLREWRIFRPLQGKHPSVDVDEDLAGSLKLERGRILDSIDT